MFKDDKVSIDPAQKSSAEDLITRLKEAIKNRRFAEIESLTEELVELSQQIGSSFYSQQQAGKQGYQQAGYTHAPPPGNGSAGQAAREGTVDVDYEVLD
jgi:hypothetical protein